MNLSLADKAYEVIKTDIITCVLRPGQQIAQPQLAERYGVGLTPVREALQRLAQEGFVQAVPRFGYIVSPIAISDVYEIYELRSIAESAAARLAAVRGSQEALRRIAEEANFTYRYRDRRSYSDFLALNSKFHLSIAEAAGNRRLANLVAHLLDELLRVFHLGLDLRDSAEEMRDEHIALATALLERDPIRAEQLVQSQIARSQQRVLEALAGELGPFAGGMLLQAIRPEDRTDNAKTQGATT
ncbi:MAG: GntR family transcriptional regulator [Anaerolineae bacterium]|nr:GntR family transcriptional regulator [Anaerolineae bacterium]